MAADKSKRILDGIKSVLSEREYQAVTKLIEEVNDKSLTESSVDFYIKEIKKTLNTITYRKNMMTCALNALEQYVESGDRSRLEFEENIKNSRLLNP